MTARDDIRTAAAANGWTVDTSSDWHDRFTRLSPVDPDGPLHRFYQVADFDPQDLVFVGYDDLGRVREVTLAGPGQQSVITGQHTGMEPFTGKGRRDRALAALSAPAGVPA